MFSRVSWRVSCSGSARSPLQPSFVIKPFVFDYFVLLHSSWLWCTFSSRAAHPSVAQKLIKGKSHKKLSTYLEYLQWPELQDKALFCFLIFSISHKKLQYSHLYMTNAWLHMEMGDQIQFLVTLWLTEVTAKELDVTWLYKLYSEPRSIPELHNFLTNGSSIILV